MKLTFVISSLLISVSSIISASALPQDPAIRQDEEMPSNAIVSSATTTLATLSASPSLQASISVVTTSIPNMSSEAGNAQSASHTSSAPPVPSAADTLTSTTGSTANITTSKEQLPIQPRIVPATAIAGIFLIVTGLVLCFVAARWDLVPDFLAGALLFAIAVTCIIASFSKQDPSTGQLAGYVVAVIIPSTIFGALCCLSQDYTSGAGCILGGFCISMWFLCLNDGGLIQNKAGKIAFILAWTLVVGAMGLYKTTRRYTLIFCLPFSGATAFVLGIDCFTCVGLKEFWIYIWDVNNEAIFPLNITTYPFTKEIQTEIGSIIAVFLFGLVANWQWFKRNRKLQAQHEIDKRMSKNALDQEEKEAGMHAKLTMEHEIPRWEKNYAEGKLNKMTALSLSEKSNDRKMSVSTDRNTIDDIELDASRIAEMDRIPMVEHFNHETGIVEKRPAMQQTNAIRPASERFLPPRGTSSKAKPPVVQPPPLWIGSQKPEAVVSSKASSSTRNLLSVSVEELGEAKSASSFKSTPSSTDLSTPEINISPSSDKAYADSAHGLSDTIFMKHASVTEEDRDLLKPLQCASTQSKRSSSTGTTEAAITTLQTSSIKFPPDASHASSAVAVKPVSLPNMPNRSNSRDMLRFHRIRESTTNGIPCHDDHAAMRPTQPATLSGQTERTSKIRVTSAPLNNFTRSSSSPITPTMQRKVSANSNRSINGRSRSQSRHETSQRSSSQTTLSKIPGRSSRRMSDSASVYLNEVFASSRLSHQNLANKFDSHQPRRYDSQPSAEDAALRLAQWRLSLNNDPKCTSPGASNIDLARQQMLIDKRMKEQQIQQQQVAKQHFGAMQEEQMRNSNGMYLHAKRMSKLQAQVKLNQ